LGEEQTWRFAEICFCDRYWEQSGHPVTAFEHVEYEVAVCHHVASSAGAETAILGRASMQSDQSSVADSKLEVADEADEAALASVMRTVPLGAAVLAGTMVALLVLGYLLIYTLVFIPRGTVG
jgi:hypothetical protein